MWRRKTEEAEVTERRWLVSSIFLPEVQAEQVWDMVMPARAARLLDPDLVEAATEEGTGPGVGEVQRFVRRYSGVETTHRIIVTRCVPPTFAETEVLDPGIPSGSRYEFEEVTGGVLFRHSSWCDIPVEHDADETSLVMTQDALDGFVLAVREFLEPAVDEGRVESASVERGTR
jgi:hypothetical protein